MTLAEALKCAHQLTGISDTARLDTEILLAWAVGRDRTYLYTWPEKSLTDTQARTFHSLLAERAQGVPIAYLTGEQEFWSLPLMTNRQTLIPRPETELLVETALSLGLPPGTRALDLGTGTGAIALALASEKPDWQISATDRVAAAVALAQANAERLSLALTVRQSDWYEALGQEERFDLIVSNPPYIDAEDEHLARGDVRFEPTSALVAAGGGLADIDTIIAGARAYLHAGGRLLIEHGWQQAPEVRALFAAYGFTGVESRRDLAGIERISMGCYE